MELSLQNFGDHECCACRTRIKESDTNFLNLINLPYRTKWKFPRYCNVLQGITGSAVAIVCDSCLVKEIPIQWAIEYSDQRIIYHEVTSLEPIIYNNGKNRLVD